MTLPHVVMLRGALKG